MTIRVFPRKTSFTPSDEWAFVGDPPMIRPEADEVHVSVAFTWDIPKAHRLVKAWGQYYPVVKIGGPAFSSPCDGFTPGLYVKEGVTFTSRGCNNKCPFCLAWRREGKLWENSNFSQGNIIQDNNLLQCSPNHIRKVFSMLKGQHSIQFTGGLDSRLMSDSMAGDLRTLRIKQLFLACDNKEATKPLAKAIGKLPGFTRRQLRCYVLLGYNGETVSEAMERLEEVWNAGAMPFAQLFQPPEKYISYSKEWKDLARTWSRPAATKALMREKE